MTHKGWIYTGLIVSSLALAAMLGRASSRRAWTSAAARAARRSALVMVRGGDLAR